MAIYKLGEISKVRMCKRIYSYQTTKNGEIPFYKIGTMNKKPDSYISKQLFENLKEKYPYPQKDDTLISCSGTIGKTFLFTGNDSYFQDSNIVWLESNFFKKKYFYYWLQKNPFVSTQGATIKRLYTSDIRTTIVNLPLIEEQQKIIDIITPKEELFLKFSNTIRIDNFEHTKNDLKNLIDIIEPVERMINSLNSSKERVVSLISKIGELSILSTKKFSSIKFEKQREKYIESGNYVSTGSIGDFNNVIEKVEELTLTPTRARLQFKKDTLYISKLDGEKKILYLNKDQDLILSNGMWGIEGDENNKYSLYAFLMSDTFYEEKKMKSTGTTMRGLNDKILNQIINSYSISTVYNGLLCRLFLLLSNSTFLLEKLIQIKNNFISLLIN